MKKPKVPAGLCGKRVFVSKYAVEGALTSARIRATWDDRRAEVRYYFCQQCHGYHMTSQAKRSKV